jgi:hypothetical protein
MANPIARTFSSVWRFYRDGFRNMTWGRPLWILIILKVVILFGVLRLFFFKPAMAGKTEEERSEIVGTNLTEGNMFLQQSQEQEINNH